MADNPYANYRPPDIGGAVERGFSLSDLALRGDLMRQERDRTTLAQETAQRVQAAQDLVEADRAGQAGGADSGTAMLPASLSTLALGNGLASPQQRDAAQLQIRQNAQGKQLLWMHDATDHVLRVYHDALNADAPEPEARMQANDLYQRYRQEGEQVLGKDVIAKALPAFDPDKFIADRRSYRSQMDAMAEQKRGQLAQANRVLDRYARQPLNIVSPDGTKTTGLYTEQEAARAAQREGGTVEKPATSASAESAPFTELGKIAKDETRNMFDPRNPEKNAELATAAREKLLQRMSAKDRFDAVNKLADEFVKDSQPFIQTQTALGKILDAVTLGTAQGDIAAAKLFETSLDASVVREGELNMELKSGGLVDSARNLIDKMHKGTLLQPGQRIALVKAVDAMGRKLGEQQDIRAAHFKRLAVSAGLDPEDVLGRVVNQRAALAKQAQNPEVSGLPAATPPQRRAGDMPAGATTDAGPVKIGGQIFNIVPLKR